MERNRRRPTAVTLPGASLIALALAAVACGAPVPGYRGLKVSVDVKVRAQVGVEAPAPVALEQAEVVEFFGIPLDGAQDIVFVLDCSGSMNTAAQGRIAALSGAQDPAQPPRKIDVARAELVVALEQLPAGTRMNVLFFNNTLDAFAQALVPLHDSGREELVRFVRGSTPMGRTALTPAMRTAFLMNARRIVLLSDGLGNLGGDSGTLLRDAREAMRGGVRIDTIGLGADQDGQLLQALARESGGLYQPL